MIPIALPRNETGIQLLVTRMHGVHPRAWQYPLQAQMKSRK